MATSDDATIRTIRTTKRDVNHSNGARHPLAHIELTLLSIIQGVALYFLVDRSYEALVSFRISFWPYAVTGLLIIFIFWSRSLIHTLTVIRWPLDLTHNFMYIACTMVQAVTFTQWTNPVHWYALNALFALLVLAAALGYLLYVMRFFSRVIPLIAKTRQEWREVERTKSSVLYDMRY